MKMFLKTRIVAVAGGLFLFSCKGDYECVCTSYGTTQSALSYYDVQRAYAKESCGFYQDQLSDPDGKCKLQKKK